MAVALPWLPNPFDPATIISKIVSWLAHEALSGVNNLWTILEKTALVTPDVTQLHQVRTLNATSLMIVNGCYVLVIMAGGALLMTKDTLQVRYGVGELAPRLVFGLIAANFAPFFVAQLIAAANALTVALTGQGVSSAGTFTRLQATVGLALHNPVDFLLSAVLCVVICGLTAMLMIAWLVRIGVLVALAGISPLALACHALPQLEGAAKLWWRSLWGCLVTVLLQALMLHSSLSIFLGDGITRRQLGLDSADSSTLNLFIVVSLLWTTVKIPALVRRHVLGGGGGRGAGTILRVVLVRQLTQVMRGKRPGSVGGAVRRASRERSSAGGRPPTASRPAASRRTATPPARSTNGPSGTAGNTRP